MSVIQVCVFLSFHGQPHVLVFSSFTVRCSGKLVQGTWAVRGFGKQCKQVRFESPNFIYKCILLVVPRISKNWSMFSASLITW